MKKYILGFLMIIAIAIPLCALAGILEGPLVPCGTSTTPPCTLCDIFVMVKNIIDFILVAIFILAPIYVLWGGFEILTSAGETGKVSNGKKKITAAVVGIIIALVAWTGLGMLFNALVSVGPGFPWPWNEVRCEGGGIIEELPLPSGSICCCDYLSGNKQQNYCKPDAYPDSSTCNASCKTFCTGFAVNAGSGYLGSCCVGRKLATGESCGNLPANYCCCNLTDGTYYCKSDSYVSLDECNSSFVSGCKGYCQAYAGEKYSTYCCVAQKGRCTAITGQWCQRTAPGGSENWKIGGPMSKSQFGDASSGLVGLINCMYGKLPNLVITAISSSVLCGNPGCDTTSPNCGHTANSCHFGGTNSNCKGNSYAVDFASNIDYSTVNIAAKQCNSSVWTLWETNHTHISIPGCGCQ